MRKARLTDCFSILYPVVEEYIRKKCFSTEIKDLENIDLRKQLRRIEIHEAITELLAKEIGKETAEKKPIKLEGRQIKLSDTPRFIWRRKHKKMKKTVFNFVAGYNNFEIEFADFLDKAQDIDAFSAMEGSLFRIDYLTSRGAIRYYFPDFVAVQTTGKNKIYWILETKGREYPELENKNNAIKRWCESVATQTKQEWRYLIIKQAKFELFKRSKKTTLSALINHCSEEFQRIM